MNSVAFQQRKEKEQENFWTKVTTRTRVTLKKPIVKIQHLSAVWWRQENIHHLQHGDHSSQQLARKLFPKLACSALLAILICATVLLSGVIYQGRTTFYDQLVPTNVLNRLFTTGRNKRVEAAVLASLLGQSSKTRATRCHQNGNGSHTKKTELLQQQLEQALAKIKQNVQKNKDLAEQISRSPRAIRTIKALEAAIATFAPIKTSPEYEISEYATGNKRWRRSPSQHPVPIQDLLLYDVQARQEKNKMLGDKVAQVVSQNLHLAQQASKAYETPSERLKKDPIMGLVTRTVATYMFLKNMNDPKQGNKMEGDDFLSWGQPFFKKKE